MAIIMHVTEDRVVVKVISGVPEVIFSQRSITEVPCIRIVTKIHEIRPEHRNRIVKLAFVNSKIKRIGHVRPLQITHNKGSMTNGTKTTT
jgi:hypothetical protein